MALGECPATRYEVQELTFAAPSKDVERRSPTLCLVTPRGRSFNTIRLYALPSFVVSVRLETRILTGEGREMDNDLLLIGGRWKRASTLAFDIALRDGNSEDLGRSDILEIHYRFLIVSCPQPSCPAPRPPRGSQPRAPSSTPRRGRPPRCPPSLSSSSCTGASLAPGCRADGRRFVEHIERYNHVFEAYAAQGISVFAYDQRGFGETGKKSGALGATSWALALGDLDYFVGHVAKGLKEGTKLFLMGHSMVRPPRLVRR